MKDVAEKVPDVGNVVGNVKFGAGIEIRLAAPNRRPNALDAEPGSHMKRGRRRKKKKKKEEEKKKKSKKKKKKGRRRR